MACGRRWWRCRCCCSTKKRSRGRAIDKKHAFRTATHPKKSLYHDAPDIVPQTLRKGMSASELLETMGKTCFEARNVARGARLFERMVREGDVIWLGIAGAGIAGGMGGMVCSLLEAGFIDVICSTGAQIYHDLHFAFALPVKAGSPDADDDLLREHGDTRIYDILIRDKETLETQDEIVCEFIRQEQSALTSGPISSRDFNALLGLWAAKTAPHPERSLTILAAQRGVPVFWDSASNHSIALNIARMHRDGIDVRIADQHDIFDSAAIAYATKTTGFVELGGGGPKNFIQQTGPLISQILHKEYAGAERGLQIGTAVEREGSLSSCTFSESVTWANTTVPTTRGWCRFGASTA
ncbi:MAG: deoxyhypusine synthase family protein [Deltaproteobacteria bacterium]|nr:deoxyhypusine synthase family protein [Deltaproteobacteria bacterium]